MPKIMGENGRSCGASWTKFVRSSISWIAVGKTIRASFIRTWMGEKFRTGECMFVHRKQGLFLSVFVDDIKMAGKKQYLAPMRKKLMKNVDIDETCVISWPRVFGMHSTGMQTKWGHHWTVHKNVRITYFCWSSRKITGMAITSRAYSSVVLQPCLDDHQFKKEELESVGELSEVCSQIVLKSLYLVRFGRPDILWSVIKLARSVTKWTQACDKRQARLISYIHRTNDYRQYCHVRNTAQHCRRGSIQDSDFAGDLEDSKETSGGVLCIFGSITFVPVSCMCKKQTSVSHSSTESEIISLDAGIRMDGLPALDLRDFVIEVLRTRKDNIQPGHTSSGKLGQIQPNHTSSGKLEYVQPNSTICDSRTKTQRVNRKQGVDQLNGVDCVPTNTRSSQGESQLYIFEFNEAVIKMIIKGRSPRLRHVSRTHRICLIG